MLKELGLTHCTAEVFRVPYFFEFIGDYKCSQHEDEREQRSVGLRGDDTFCGFLSIVSRVVPKFSVVTVQEDIDAPDN